MDNLSLFGLLVIAAGVIFYALEGFGRGFILAFAAANGLASIYAFLQGAWPYGLIEIVWTVAALGRWWSRRPVPFEAIGLPPQACRVSATKLVERCSMWSGVAGLIPVPFVDLAALGGVQIQMLRLISRIYGIPFSENRGKAFIASLAGSMISASSGIGAVSLLKAAPGVGTVISVIVMPAMSAGATYAIGMAFIQHFATGGTLLDFDPAGYREFVIAQKALWGSRTGAVAAAAGSARRS